MAFASWRTEKLTQAGPAIVNDAWSKIEGGHVETKQPKAVDSAAASLSVASRSDEDKQTVTTPSRASPAATDLLLQSQRDQKVSPERGGDTPTQPPGEPSSSPTAEASSSRLSAEAQNAMLVIDADKTHPIAAHPDLSTATPAISGSFASPNFRGRHRTSALMSPAPTGSATPAMPSPSTFASLPPLHPVYSAPSPRVRDNTSSSGSGSGSGSMGSVLFPPLEAPLLSATPNPSALASADSATATSGNSGAEAVMSPKSPAGLSMLAPEKSAEDKKDHKHASPDEKKPSDPSATAAGAKITPPRASARRSSMSKFGEEKALVSARRPSLFEDEEDQVLQAPSTYCSHID
jgi:hypothetical protein